ncbi:molecular chaperone [Bermanella sp. WJH001]|uniref:molecular chaperone n=1 Tax=Bermanella sp. WJH001 TaxID=3048005 RepID=UPI0024BF0258|nr:molecular chaperone [Bermanella sp. WJH001]MDJ1537754.1 molecular chaperone [Bermanella sp. WJH001]
MITGFDFGTSNCAMGVLSNQQDVQLLPIENGKAFMPSTLYALDRDLITEQVALQISNPEEKQAFIEQRRIALNRARRVRDEEGFSPNETSLFVGHAALAEYFAWPGEGYFVKSPKSFLGASGLSDSAIHFFEDIVTAMMMAVKQRSQAITQQDITHTVIGRPVNFQGLNAEQSNEQALTILTRAAKRAGFKGVEFLFEPIGAALSYEQKLTEDKTVLVMDIGGGTTDCAMVRMGPSHRNKDEREQDFIGHTGERIGGNDLDIQLAGQHLMPLFGMLSNLKNGLPMPTQTFWDAVRTNDVGAQSAFNDKNTTALLQQLYRDTSEPDLIKRFIKLRNEKQNNHLVRSAEQTKIVLSNDLHTDVDLGYIEDSLSCTLSREQLASAIDRPLTKMMGLMSDAIKQAGTKPDLVYVTGGSGQSPIIRQAIAQTLGDIAVVDGDHFGSVANGLTVWAGRVFA